MIKLLANENIPLETIRILQNKGIDICSIYDTSPGLTDEEVIDKAIKEKRILVTFDKDFGELVFRKKHKAKGVVLLRIKARNSAYIADTIYKLLNNKNFSIEHNFCVVAEQNIRLIPIK